MSVLMTPEEFLAKVDYEGGWGSAFEYGITPDWIDPEEDPGFHKLLLETYDSWQILTVNESRLRGYVEAHNLAEAVEW